MKNTINKLFRDRVLISVMFACIFLITAAGLITVYNRNNNQKNNDNQLVKNTTESDENTAFTEDTGTEEETKRLIVRIETTPEAETDVSKEEPDVRVDVQPETESVPETLPTSDSAKDVTPSQEAAADPVVTFDDNQRLIWPVGGEIIRDFSMDTTVWFSTLKQYMVSDAIQIQSEEGIDVLAPAAAYVYAVGSTDELGGFVVLDIGSGYRVWLAQIKDVTVNPGEYVKAGDVIASVAAPSYYYSSDGDHVYMKMTKDDVLLDPLSYLN